MKSTVKFFLMIIAFIFMTISANAQGYNTSLFVVPNSTTQFGLPLAVGRIVIDVNSGKFYQITAYATATTTLAGATKTELSDNPAALDTTYISIEQLVSTYTWQNPVLAIWDSVAPPAEPDSLDRYISADGVAGWTENKIYQYNGTTWDSTSVTNGMAVVNLDDSEIYLFTTSWNIADKTEEQGLIQFWQSVDNNITNTNSGSVGIGTATPTQKLHVQGGNILVGGGYLNINNYGYLTYSAGKLILKSLSGKEISFRTNNSSTDALTINTNGKLSTSISNYENLVNENNDIPNRKWVTDTLNNYSLTTDIHSIKSDSSGISDSSLYAYDYPIYEGWGINISNDSVKADTTDLKDYFYTELEVDAIAGAKRDTGDIAQADIINLQDSLDAKRNVGDIPQSEVTNLQDSLDAKRNVGDIPQAEVTGLADTLNAIKATIIPVDTTTYTWLDPVIGFWHTDSLVPPVIPSVGDRYISYGTVTGWTNDKIYEWNGTIWNSTAVSDGLAAVIVDSAKVYVYYTSGGWVTQESESGGLEVSGWSESGVALVNTNTGYVIVQGAGLYVHPNKKFNAGILPSNNTTQYEFSKAGSDNLFSLSTYSSNVNHNSYLYFLKSGSNTVLSATPNNSIFGTIAFQGVNSSANKAIGSYIRGTQEGSGGATYVPGKIEFYTGTATEFPSLALTIDKNKDVTAEGNFTADTLFAKLQQSDVIGLSGSLSAKLNWSELKDSTKFTTIITVGGSNEDYPTIQQGLNAAGALGGFVKVSVSPGTYVENIIIPDSITLDGNYGATIYGTSDTLIQMGAFSRMNNSYIFFEPTGTADRLIYHENGVPTTVSQMYNNLIYANASASANTMAEIKEGTLQLYNNIIYHVKSGETDQNNCFVHTKETGQLLLKYNETTSLISDSTGYAFVLDESNAGNNVFNNQIVINYAGIHVQTDAWDVVFYNKRDSVSFNLIKNNSIVVLGSGSNGGAYFMANNASGSIIRSAHNDIGVDYFTSEIYYGKIETGCELWSHFDKWCIDESVSKLHLLGDGTFSGAGLANNGLWIAEGNVPAASNSAGYKGEFRVGSDGYLYYCTQTGEDGFAAWIKVQMTWP